VVGWGDGRAGFLALLRAGGVGKLATGMGGF